MNVLPAPVIGPEEELESSALLLDPQPAAARAITPQHKTASVDLREITSLRLLRRLSDASVAGEARVPVTRWWPGCEKPVNG
jgi:hypothetical protein